MLLIHSNIFEYLSQLFFFSLFHGKLFCRLFM